MQSVTASFELCFIFIRKRLTYSKKLTTVLALAGTPTATVWSSTTHDLLGKFVKNMSERRKIHEKDTKNLKVALFSPIDFGQPDSFRIIGSPI
jgi:hypothetical protein